MWYKTGTIDVTNASNTIVGNGTSWTNTITAGDMLLVSNVLYEIDIIVSDTEITLVSNYLGSTDTAISYDIILNVVTQSNLAGRITGVVDQWKLREDEITAWQGGVVDGGPNSDGQYPLTDPDGIEHLINCPALMEQNLDTHEALVDNPHVVTSTQIGLGETLVNLQVRSEAQFMSEAASNRDKFGGSGFIEFGKHYDNVSYPNINDGMWSWPTHSNELQIGDALSPAGASKTNYPVADINGVIQRIAYVRDSNEARNQIDFPEAPLAENFVTNGIFDTDTSGWTAVDSTIAAVSGELEVTATASNGYATDPLNLEAGRTYLLEVKARIGTSNLAKVIVYDPVNGSVEVGSTSSPSLESIRHEFVAEEDTSILLRTGGVVGTSYFDDVSIIDLGKVERQDLVFLENWHEDITDKDFVYPYGNVQSFSVSDPSTGLSTANGSFTGYGTYSLFGNWQADSALIGKGLIWSTMTDANKKKFVSDLDNNIYLSEDGDLIQVRYRIRVVEGLGADWLGLDSTIANGTDSTYLAYTTTNRIQAKAAYTSIDDDFTDGSNAYFTRSTTFPPDSGTPELGEWAARNILSTFAYKDLNFALPIALVSRRNQGAFHPVFNPNGCAGWRNNAATGTVGWFDEPNIIANSTYDCFIDTGATVDANRPDMTYSGYIGSSRGGDDDRPDSKLYDAIYESDVLDLRNSAHKQDLTRTLQREFNKLVAGDIRGWEGESFVEVADTGIVEGEATSGTAGTITFGTNINVLDHIVVINQAGVYIISGFVRVDYGAAGQLSPTFWEAVNGTGTIAFNRTNGDIYTILRVTKNLEHKTSLQCDIIGDPANYPQAWVDNGVMGTPLIYGEEGEDYIPDGTAKEYKLSRKVKEDLLVVFSDDSGATWSTGADFVSYNSNWSETTNSFNTASWPATRLSMMFYETEATPFETADNSEVLALGNVWAGTNGDLSDALGAWLVSNLIGKIPISTSVGDSEIIPLTSYGLMQHGGEEGKLNIIVLPKHSGITDELNTGSPAVKILPQLTRENGKLFLQALFKEMKYDSTLDTINELTDGNKDGTIAQAYTEGEYYLFTNGELDGQFFKCAFTSASYTVDSSASQIANGNVVTNSASTLLLELWNGSGWGDDNKFNVVDGTDTVDDSNTNPVLIGQKRIELPYFIGDVE